MSAATSAESDFSTVRSHTSVFPAYQVMVCHRCYAANWDGWALKLDETVTRNLKAKGIRIPERNTKGLLPRDGF